MHKHFLNFWPHLYGLTLMVTVLTASADPLLAADTRELRLDNGLRVVVREDHRAPTVVHMVWYPIGSIDETDNLSGISHLLEHMMFKGTPTHGPGEFSRLVAAAGGRDNAFTSHDYTAYFEQVPKEMLPQMMALEADRMVNLRLDAKELEQEAKVVMEERRMRTDDDAQGLLQEALWATAFKVHPYRRPIIGWMSDLENINVDDLRTWYHTWYSPSRATVVVVGDVNIDDVFKLAQKYYGVLPGTPLAARRTFREPTQTGIQRINVKAPAQLPRLEMVWKVPSLTDEKNAPLAYAMDVLAEILSGYDAARLPSRLVRGNRSAVDAGASMDLISRSSVNLYSLSGTPSQGHTVAELEKHLRMILAQVAEKGVAAEELKRAKTQALAQRTYELDSMFAQAMWIGRLEVTGLGWQSLDRIMEGLQAVTSADIQKAIATYLVDDNLTVATLDPQPLKDGPKRAPVHDIR